MVLIAGLGNPGHVYQHSRHNIGFMCLSHIAGKHGIRLDKKAGQARTGAGEIAGYPVVLARPQTGMNASGESVARLVSRLNISPRDLIVIYDDLDLPLGKIRLRFDGGSGGHNGMDSIIDGLGSQDFYRVRVGIGRPIEELPEDKDARVIDYVLGDFAPHEMKAVEEVTARVGDAVACLITEGLTVAMNRYN